MWRHTAHLHLPQCSQKGFCCAIGLCTDKIHCDWSTRLESLWCHSVFHFPRQGWCSSVTLMRQPFFRTSLKAAWMQDVCDAVETHVFMKSKRWTGMIWYKLEDFLPLRSSLNLLTSIWRRVIVYESPVLSENSCLEGEREGCVFGCAQSLFYYSRWMHT